MLISVIDRYSLTPYCIKSMFIVLRILKKYPEKEDKDTKLAVLLKYYTCVGEFREAMSELIACL